MKNKYINITATDLYKLYPNMKYYKLSNEEDIDIHTNKKIKDGLNESYYNFKYYDGPMIFTIDNIYNYNEHMYEHFPAWIREVTFPDDALISDYYDYLTSNKYILSERQPFNGPFHFDNQMSICPKGYNALIADINNKYSDYYFNNKFNNIYNNLPNIRNKLEYIRQNEKTVTNIYYFNYLDMDWKNLYYIKNQNPIICAYAILINSQALKYVKKKSEQLHALAIRQ